jgi:hypothetical protein
VSSRPAASRLMRRCMTFDVLSACCKRQPPWHQPRRLHPQTLRPRATCDLPTNTLSRSTHAITESGGHHEHRRSHLARSQDRVAPA